MTKFDAAGAVRHGESARDGGQGSVELPFADEWSAGMQFRQGGDASQTSSAGHEQQSTTADQTSDNTRHDQWVAQRREQIARRSNEYYTQRARVDAMRRRRAVRMAMFMSAIVIVAAAAFVTPFALNAYPSGSLFGVFMKPDETRVASIAGSGSVYMTDEPVLREPTAPDQSVAPAQQPVEPSAPASQAVEEPPAQPEPAVQADDVKPLQSDNTARPATDVIQPASDTIPAADPGLLYEAATASSTSDDQDALPEPQAPGSETASASAEVSAGSAPAATAQPAAGSSQQPAAQQPQVVAALDPALNQPAESSVTKTAPSRNAGQARGEVKQLLEHGDRLMQLGDIVSARALYLRALDADQASAALRLGSTFDPLIYGRIGVRGLRPDAAKALEWYLTAAEAGNEDAKRAYEALKATGMK